MHPFCVILGGPGHWSTTLLQSTFYGLIEAQLLFCPDSYFCCKSTRRYGIKEGALAMCCRSLATAAVALSTYYSIRKLVIASTLKRRSLNLGLPIEEMPMPKCPYNLLILLRILHWAAKKRAANDLSISKREGAGFCVVVVIKIGPSTSPKGIYEAIQ